MTLNRRTQARRYIPSGRSMYDHMMRVVGPMPEARKQYAQPTVAVEPFEHLINAECRANLAM